MKNLLVDFALFRDHFNGLLMELINKHDQVLQNEDASIIVGKRNEKTLNVILNNVDNTKELLSEIVLNKIGAISSSDEYIIYRKQDNSLFTCKEKPFELLEDDHVLSVFVNNLATKDEEDPNEILRAKFEERGLLEGYIERVLMEKKFEVSDSYEDDADIRFAFLDALEECVKNELILQNKDSSLMIGENDPDTIDIILKHINYDYEKAFTYLYNSERYQFDGKYLFWSEKDKCLDTYDNLSNLFRYLNGEESLFEIITNTFTYED